MDLNHLINRFKHEKAIEPQDNEFYGFTRENAAGKMRIHLRIDRDGTGTLLLNASRILHLNPSAALMAKNALQEHSMDQAAQELAQRFSVSAKQAKDDYAKFLGEFNQLLDPEAACLIHDLELDTLAPFSLHPSAPYRMDLALTYRCNNDCSHCYNARPRTYPELPSEHWHRMIDRIWELGIPHIVFTGGEPTLRQDLPELIGYAQKIGLVTGLNTNGRRLSDPKFINELVSAGLDHVQVTLESHNPEIHNEMVNAKGAWQQTVRGIKNALDTPLFVMTNTTMLHSNAATLEQTLDFLAELGVPTVGLNALIYAGAGATCGDGLNESELTPLLELARNKTDTNHQRLIWYTPTQYCHFDPMDLELGVKGCTAALYNMCVEPDGMVIPCQSYYQPLGSLLADPWEEIWDHELAVSLRNRRYVAEKCSDCLLLPECGGGCPLSEIKE